MEKQQLQTNLRELGDTLAKAGPIDDQTKQLLQSVTNELQRLLQQDEQLSPESVGRVHRDLKDLLLQFETQHPQLTAILGRIADGLSNVGI